MESIGIVEGFFGPQWPERDRRSFAEFLGRFGGGFYIYAPKQDPHLRKAWRDPWSSEYVAKLDELCRHFKSHGVAFGVGFSPFGLGLALSEADEKFLEEKLRILSDLKIDVLGLFFDDMPVTENLARTQVEAGDLIRRFYRGKIVFCPSFYSDDPILEKVFGKKPDRYLEDVARLLPPEVSIAWTGPKVISPEISGEHLREVAELLKRKPFIWENLYANDGPRNCKFLKLKPFTGRTEATFREAEAFAFNMMNQPNLSKIVYLASKYVLEENTESEEALQRSLRELTSEGFRDFFRKNRDSLARSLDDLTPEQRASLRTEATSLVDAAAAEIRDWLDGVYTVGSECLTD